MTGSASQTSASSSNASAGTQSPASPVGTLLPSVSPHPGLSDAAFKRAVGETPPSPDDLEKV